MRNYHFLARKRNAPSEVEQIRTALNNLGETKLRDTTLVHILCHGLRASEVASLNVGNYNVGKAEEDRNYTEVIPQCLWRLSNTTLAAVYNLNYLT